MGIEIRCFYKIANKTEEAKRIREDRCSHGDCEGCEDKSETAPYCHFYKPKEIPKFEEDYEDVSN